ncbi:MAG: tryptophan-rich sensory protein [Herpetosiphon sp.]|nr:tryptophan-rich sensory protein [Herpetosiphon sp.]
MKLQRIMNFVATIATIAINTLAVTLPIAGRDTGAISDAYPTRFTPAGYVFSIWSVIYTGLIAFSIYQLLPSQRDNKLVDRMGWWYVISCVCNMVWIFLWHYLQFPLTMVVMLGILGSLIMVYLSLRVGREDVSFKDKLFVQIPFSIYLGWITVATIANASVLLYSAGWRGGPIGESLWVTILLVIAVVIGALMALRHRDVAYLGVLVWAFIGIAVKQSAYASVQISAIAAAIAIAILILVAMFRSKPIMRQRLA